MNQSNNVLCHSRKLSFWQLPVQSVKKISPIWDVSVSMLHHNVGSGSNCHECDIYIYCGNYLCKFKHKSVWSRVSLSWNPWHDGCWRFRCLFQGHSSLQWRNNGCDGVSTHKPHIYLLNRVFRRRSKKTSKLRVWPLCGEFTGDRWISRTNGQKRGKCFHLMTSS